VRGCGPASGCGRRDDGSGDNPATYLIRPGTPQALPTLFNEAILRSRRLGKLKKSAEDRNRSVQSTGEAIPITLSISRLWKGQASTVSALTVVDWAR
jgi:hypothetical protein